MSGRMSPGLCHCHHTGVRGPGFSSDFATPAARPPSGRAGPDVLALILLACATRFASANADDVADLDRVFYRVGHRVGAGEARSVSALCGGVVAGVRLMWRSGPFG